MNLFDTRYITVVGMTSTFSDTISGAVGVESTCCSWGRISAAAIDYLTLDSR